MKNKAAKESRSKSYGDRRPTSLFADTARLLGFDPAC